MSASNAMPVLTKAAEWLLSEILRITEDNELDVSKSSAWIFTYPYNIDNQGNAYHENINIKNDKSIRSLLTNLQDNNLLIVQQTIEHNYIPDNITLSTPYKYIHALEFIATNKTRLKDYKNSSCAQFKVAEGVIYDKQSGLITINGRTAQITGKKQRTLMDILFKNERSMRKRWDQDEIRELIDPAQPDLIDNLWAYYTAKNINRKLAATLHIDDLIKAETYTVKINPQYLL